MEQELKNWVKTFYGGCEKAGKVKLVSFNDKYSLCYLKGSTGYVGRMSGNKYSPSEWYVFENLANLDRNYFKIPKPLFSHEGRLTKEMKEDILIRFDLEFPKTERKKHKTFDDIYLVAIDKYAFWGRGFSSPIFCQKLIKKEDNKYITFSISKNKNVTFNTSKYHCTEVDSENREEFCNNLSKLVSEYRKISSALNDKQNEILNVFK